MKKVTSFFRKRKGQAMLELALIAPMMLFVFMAAFDIAMYQVARFELMSAARDTMRRLMLEEPRNAQPQAVITFNAFAKEYQNGILTFDTNKKKIEPGSELNDPMLVQVCGNVRLTIPYKGIWGNLENGQKRVCISYVGMRHTTNKN